MGITKMAKSVASAVTKAMGSSAVDPPPLEPLPVPVPAPKMKLNDRTRLALAVWAKAILGDPSASKEKRAMAKNLYEGGVDAWNSKLFVFFQTHWSSPTNDTKQADVDGLVTAVIEDYLAAKSIKDAP